MCQIIFKFPLTYLPFQINPPQLYTQFLHALPLHANILGQYEPNAAAKRESRDTLAGCSFSRTRHNPQTVTTHSILLSRLWHAEAKHDARECFFTAWMRQNIMPDSGRSFTKTRFSASSITVCCPLDNYTTHAISLNLYLRPLWLMTMCVLVNVFERYLLYALCWGCMMCDEYLCCVSWHLSAQQSSLGSQIGQHDGFGISSTYVGHDVEWK